MQATPARKDVDNNNSNDHNNYDNNGNSTENATKKETHTIPLRRHYLYINVILETPSLIELESPNYECRIKLFQGYL